MIGNINQLPEDCLSHVISFTTPRDACVLSAVSPSFRSAADFDTTWQRFLPPDLPLILSRAVEPVQYHFNKALYFQLCNHPVLIDDGRMSFGLERSSGAKCFMISARAMWIVNDHRWQWIPLSESRFIEGPELLNGCWLEIHATIERNILSSHTAYTANFIYKLLENSRGLDYPPQQYNITIGGESVCNRSLRMKTGDITRRPAISNAWRWERMREELEEMRHVALPIQRSDGWMELEIGEFYNEEGGDGVVEVRIMEIEGGHWKKGLIIQGIEIRRR